MNLGDVHNKHSYNCADQEKYECLASVDSDCCQSERLQVDCKHAYVDVYGECQGRGQDLR
mgnify:CR=1 FL=1